MSSAAQLEALRFIYEQGGFLRRAKPDKSLVGLMAGTEYSTDASGQIRFSPDASGTMRAVGQHKKRARSWWGELIAHLDIGGHVLYYAPGLQGILVLDFDPMIEERLEIMSALLGNAPYRYFKSSGKWKAASGNRPAGYGGHAVWKIDPNKAEAAASIRRFSHTTDGDHWGEAFTGHPGYGVIVWDAIAIAETMDLDDCEIVDPTRLPVARYSLAKRNADGSWEAGEGSRHDAAISEISKAAGAYSHPTAFEAAIDYIKKSFLSSFDDPKERNSRMIADEWERIESHGRQKWERKRISAREASDNHNALIKAIRNNRR